MIQLIKELFEGLYKKRPMRTDNSFLDKIEELATRMGLSRAEVLRQAIGLYAQSLAQAEEGRVIQFVDQELAEEIDIIPTANVDLMSEKDYSTPEGIQ
jgi:hypothetical protein